MAKKILNRAGIWKRNILILGAGRTGKMSLVGPRPYLPREFEKMGGYRKTILKALPGMTGLWQVSGENELSFEDRLRLAEYYVRNWSLWLDFVILVKTAGVVWRGEGV